MTHETKAYDELIDFIAAGSSPGDVIRFRPSDSTRRRVADLLDREKNMGLDADEQSELDHFLLLEHLMRLAKARARRYMAHE